MTTPSHPTARTALLPDNIDGKPGLPLEQGSHHNERTDGHHEQPPLNRDDYLGLSPYEADGGQKVGLDPASIGLEKLRALGHPESPIRAIRAKCIDCSGGSTAEVRKCVAIGCPNWPFRMGRNPFHARAGRRARS